MTKKLRLLIDVNSLVNQKSGVGYYTERLLESLENYTSNENLTITGFYNDFANRRRPDLSPFIRTRFKSVKIVPTRLVSLLRKIGINTPIEVLLPSAFWKYDAVIYPNFVSMPSISKLPSIPIIHDLSFIDHPDYVSARNAAFLKKNVPLSLSRARAFITISRFTKNRIESFYNPHKPSLVTGIPAVAGKKRLPYDAKGRGILHVGTLEPRKNIVNLIKGYSLLPAHLQTLHPLLLAGGKGWNDKEIRAELVNAKRQGRNIKELGYVSDAKREKLYKECACLVSISHYEGFGMPLLEAMHYYKPLVISNIPVYKEVAENAATYCDKDNPNDIADKLQSVLGSKKNISNNEDYEKVLSKYSWKENAEGVVELIRQIR